MKRLMKIAYDYNLALEFFKHELCYYPGTNDLSYEFVSETCIQDALADAMVYCGTAKYNSGDDDCSYEYRTGEPSYWEVHWDVNEVIKETIENIDIPTLTDECYRDMTYYFEDNSVDDPKYKDHIEEFKQIMEDKSTFQKIITDIVHSNELKELIAMYADEDSYLSEDATEQIIDDTIHYDPRDDY